MKTTSRFNNAINKLYVAFHNKHLNPEDCTMCAVNVDSNTSLCCYNNKNFVLQESCYNHFEHITHLGHAFT